MLHFTISHPRSFLRLVRFRSLRKVGRIDCCGNSPILPRASDKLVKIDVSEAVYMYVGMRFRSYGIYVRLRWKALYQIPIEELIDEAA